MEQFLRVLEIASSRETLLGMTEALIPAIAEVTGFPILFAHFTDEAGHPKMISEFISISKSLISFGSATSSVGVNLGNDN